jgi:hypothetical protein
MNTISSNLRTVIAGSRTILGYKYLLSAIDKLDWNISVVISGTAKGVDRLGERWANDNNIELEKYPAQWDTYGNSAGYKRNELMAQKAEAALILWDGTSKGTKHMIALAKKYNLKLKVFKVIL